MTIKELFAPSDMTVGKPWEKIVAFTIPMLIGNIAQQLYNTVDSIVIGKYVGDNALAAVGSASPILNLLLVLFVGISVGGLERTAPRIIIMMEEIAVSVTQFPIVIESSFLCFAPKYCDTMTPAPTEIPTNRTRSRFKIGLALPTAASALSQTYFPITIL